MIKRNENMLLTVFSNSYDEHDKIFFSLSLPMFLSFSYPLKLVTFNNKGICN